MRQPMLLRVCAATALLSACATSSTPLNMAFAGTWKGTVALGGQVAGTYPSELVVSVLGDSLQVSELCPEGSGRVTARGSGGFAAWQGTLACPAVPLANCPSVVFTYTSVVATLDGEQLTVVVTGNSANAPGCPGGGTLTVSFVARQ